MATDRTKRSDEERARNIAYEIRTKGLDQEKVVAILVKLIEDVRGETALQYW